MLFSVTMPTTPRHPSYNPITRRSVFLLLIAFVFVAARADAQANTALQFDGSTGYVGFGNPAKLQLSSFTIETWFMRTGTGTVSDTGAGGITNVLPLVTKGRGETDGSAVDMNYFLGIDTGRNNVLAADFEEGATGSSPGLNHPVRGTTPIQNNIWYHGAATYDGTTWRLYLNGNLEATLVVGKPPRSDSIQPAAIASGLNSTGTPAGYFSGVIDEARIWDRALSAAEIQQNINSELTSGSGLVARWGFNEGVGTAVDDSTAQPATGTLRGAASVWVSGAPFNIRINHPPDAPVLAAPADGASNIGTSATLDVTASDPDGDDLSVTFYGRSLSGTPGPDFMIAVLPDSQYYTAALNGGTPAMFDSQTQWIINNAASKNIVYVAHEGDITDSNISTQWDNANTAMSTLEVSPGVGFGLTLGNHDENGGTALFNQYFGASRFTGRPYYGGHYGTNNNNHYDLFGASGQEFIVVYLEYNASLNTAVMSWANNLLQTYRNRKAIIVNHDLLTSAVTPAPFSSEGQKIYDTLKANPNLFLMLCGHAWGEGRRSDAYNGNTVNTLIADYQDRTNGGSGWMRLLQFSPANNTIHVTTYSPWLNQSESDADSQFDLPYTPSFSMIGATTIAWNAHAAATWSGLYPGTAYEWYAAVNDGISTVTGPTWTFATANLGNRPPIAVNDEAATIEGTPVVIYVVSNDSDPDADAMTVASVTNAAHGAVLVNADNTVTYASEPGFAGTDTFTYTVKDPGNAESNAATVTITVRAINRPPSANAQAVTTDEGAAKAITLTGSDPDGDPLTYAVVTNPAHGTLSGTAPNLTYTPALNYSGADSFTFKVNDGTVDSAPATVTITVRAVNRAPVANAQAVTTNEDTSTGITLTGSDPDGDPLTYAVVTNPAHGTLSGTAPNLTYTPALNYSGADSFTFKVNDGTVDSAPATVTITVRAVNRAPVANAQAVTTNEDTSTGITLTGSDPDGDPLTYAVVTNPAHGLLSGMAPNLTYTPALNYSGADSFTFKVNDGTASSAPAVVTININPVNDPPVAMNGSISTTPGTPVQDNVLATDVDGDALTYRMVAPPKKGSITFLPTGAFTYIPSKGKGTEIFTFQAFDGKVWSNIAKTTIMIK